MSDYTIPEVVEALERAASVADGLRSQAFYPAQLVQYERDAARLRWLAANIEALMRDAERWRSGRTLGFPEFCGHWEGAPKGHGWYHAVTGKRWFVSADDALDAAIDSGRGKG